MYIVSGGDSVQVERSSHMNFIILYIYVIWYIYIFNRSWVDTRWQQYITHLHTNSTHNTEKGKLGSAGRAPSLRIIPWHLPYNWAKSTEKPQLRSHNTRTMNSNKNNEQSKKNNEHRTTKNTELHNRENSTLQASNPALWYFHCTIYSCDRLTFPLFCMYYNYVQQYGILKALYIVDTCQIRGAYINLGTT
jgi:hypothetical protein